MCELAGAQSCLGHHQPGLSPWYQHTRANVQSMTLVYVETVYHVQFPSRWPWVALSLGVNVGDPD